MELLISQLKKLDNVKTVTLRTSARNVPHIIVNTATQSYSICWFANSQRFRVFFPYPSKVQTRKNFDTISDLIQFFKTL